MNEMTIRGTGKMANLQVWSQRVAECRGSGMPVSRWCQENGINVKTYYNWQKKVFEAMVEEQQDGPRFARVSAQQSEASIAATVRIGPASVDVYTGADAETVAAIVRALTVC